MGFLLFLGALLLVAYVLVGWFIIYKGVESGARFVAGFASKRSKQEDGPLPD